MSPWPPAGSIRTTRTPLRGPVPRSRRRTRWRDPLARCWRDPLARCLAVLLAVAAVVAPAVPAGAVTDDGARPRMVLNGLQAVVGPPSPEAVPASEQNARLPSAFSARVLVANPTDEDLEDLDLLVQVYGRATSRSELRAALDGGGAVATGIGRVVLEQAIDVVPAGGVAQVDISIDAEEAGFLDSDHDVTVHPVVISLAQGFRAVDEVRTAAIGVSRPVARPLETAVVLPLDGPAPSTGESLAATADLLLPGGRLDRLLRAVEGTPQRVVTAAPAPHAVEDLIRLVDEAAPGATDMLARLRAVHGERTAGTISSPYALADVPALTSSPDTEDLAVAAIVAGRQRLLGLVGVAPDGAHLLLSPQTPTSLDLAPVDVLVTSWDDAAGPDLTANPTADIPSALRTARSASGRALDVLVADPWVTDQLATATGEAGWAVDAHRVIAESAITFAQAPSREGRTFAVLPPTGWDAPGRLPDELVSRLAAAPWLRSADPVTVAARGRVAGMWDPASGVSGPRTALLPRLAELQQRLGGLAAAVVEAEAQPAVVARGDDLLRAVTTWPEPEPLLRGTRVLDDLEEGIAEAIGQVVVPRESMVTLASESGVIPVTVRHPEGVAMDVVVEVATPGGLSFEEGTTRPVHLEEDGTATVSFQARALGRGTFPMAVTVRTPTGDLVLAEEVLSVRASAVSRPALLAIGGVVLLLLVVGRLRRPGRPRLEVVR